MGCTEHATGKSLNFDYITISTKSGSCRALEKFNRILKLVLLYGIINFRSAFEIHNWYNYKLQQN